MTTNYDASDLLTMLVCSSTLWGDPTNSRNSVGATESSRWENLLAASTESSSRNSILATGIPAWSTSTVVSTADFTVGKEHTAATVWERGGERESGEREESRKRKREREKERGHVYQICLKHRWPFTDASTSYGGDCYLSDTGILVWADHLLPLELRIAWQLSEW